MNQDFFYWDFYKHASRLLWKGEKPEVDYLKSAYSIWIAEIAFFRPRRDPPIKSGGLTVAVSKTRQWHRGIILIPPIIQPTDRDFGGPSPLLPVDLVDWDDPVAFATQSINLLINHKTTFALDDFAMPLDVNLYFETATSRGLLSIEEDTTYDDSRNHLKMALLETIYHLVDKYNDSEFNLFVQHERPLFEHWKEQGSRLSKTLK